MIDMNNLEAVLANKTKTLFMAHMIAGYPSVDESEKVAEEIVSKLGDHYTYRIIGFTIVVRKWRKARKAL